MSKVKIEEARKKIMAALEERRRTQRGTAAEGRAALLQFLGSQTASPPPGPSPTPEIMEAPNGQIPMA